jgi:hypothetical protein
MISPERAGLLKTFLGSLPEEIATRLAQAVEADRLIDGKMLPHEMILESLRPALRRSASADRTPTALRAFCQPFEDLLTFAPRTVKQKGRIARSSVAPMWTWIQSLLPDETRRYCTDFRALLLAARHGEAQERAAAFWPLAAAAMRTALAHPAGAAASRVVLGGDLAVADAAEMALLLSVGDEIAQVQRLLPRALPALGDELLWGLRNIYDGLAATTPDAAPYVAVVAMHRLAKPWEALKLPLSISRQTQDTLISLTDMGLVGEIIFGDIEAFGAAVHGARHPDFDVERLLDNLSRFTALSSGIVKGIELRRDGKWGQRLLRDRAALAEVMDGFMARAPRELAGALPLQKGHAMGASAADFSRPVDPERLDRALRYARLVAGCQPLASAASFGASAKQAWDEMGQLLLAHNEDVIRELRLAGEPRRAVVEARFDFVCRLTAILLSDEEADFLRRRGKAALQAAIAA